MSKSKNSRPLINLPLHSHEEVGNALKHIIASGARKRDRMYRAVLLDCLINSKYPGDALTHLRMLDESDVLEKEVGPARLKRLAVVIAKVSSCQEAVWMLTFIKDQKKYVHERIVLLKKILKYPKSTWMRGNFWEFAGLVPEERAMLIEAVRRSGTLAQAQTLQTSKFGEMPPEQAQELQQLVEYLQCKFT